MNKYGLPDEMLFISTLQAKNQLTPILRDA
jgi:hypothetical protein